jgi:hypothetical protein
MSEFKGDHNTSHPGSVRTRVQAAWSQRRAWPGDEITMSLRTELVKDNATADIQVLDESGQKVIDAVRGKKISEAKLDHPYQLEWKDKPYEDARKFVLKATIEAKLDSNPSPPMLVDLEPPVFSA